MTTKTKRCWEQPISFCAAAAAISTRSPGNWQVGRGKTGLILAAKRGVPLNQLEPGRVDLRGKRLLIFIVAYNAESTIEKVLTQIPKSLHSDQVEVLIIDDSSQDETFRNGL